MKLIYICSPYAGDVRRNTELARAYCAAAVTEGVIPVAPHLIFPQFLDDSDPKQREIGLMMGLELLNKCEELWLCTQEMFPGMVLEYKHALRAGITTWDRSADWMHITLEGGGQDLCLFTHQT